MSREIKLYTPEDVSRMTQIPLATLAFWRSRPPADPIPFVRMGRFVRYKHSDIEHWLERNTWDKASDRFAG